MQIIGLIGHSGTGKSHRAVTLAAEMQAEAIIDDGLLIAGNRILAGRSAKAEASRLAAVRRAIFQDEQHAAEVKQAIAKLAPQRLLVLGTSPEMVQRIGDALALPAAERLIFIQEVVSDEEMRQAQQQRTEEGTHVIPVAPTEVRRLIPVVITDLFDTIRRYPRSEPRANDRTQVKPTFATGASGAPLQLTMVYPLIEQAIADAGLTLFRLNQASLQQKPGLVLSLDLAASPAGLKLAALGELQLNVKRRVQRATGREIASVELTISSLL